MRRGVLKAGNITLRLDETSTSTVVLVTRVCGQHANLLREVFEAGRLLGGASEDQSFFRHGTGIACRVELFVQDFDSRGEFGSFLIHFAGL